MKPICLIPARAGSKGLPNKNMLFLYGKPMLFHTIDAAIESGCFEKEDIYVSTDSELYKEICETRGIKVLLRPEELSTDFTTSYEVNEHFLKDFEDDQVFVLLQVTSPLRNGQNIREAMDLYLQGQAENVVSFSKVEKSPKFFTELDDNNFALGIYGVDKGYRRQNDKQELYAPNGAIYITSKSVYLENKSYYTPRTQAYIMDKEDSIDVDDRLDFTSVIGRIYFDYRRREMSNKQFYQQYYQKLVEGTTQSGLLLGDSRLVGCHLEGYTNLSIGGVTIATILANQATFLTASVDKVILAAGVNDLITGYSMEEIRQHLEELVAVIEQKGAQLILVEVPYTLFRDSVSNEDITLLNELLKEIAQDKNLKFVETNHQLAPDGHLEFKYTTDGLHFNDAGQDIYFGLVSQLV